MANEHWFKTTLWSQVLKAKASDRSAWEAMVERYRPPVVRFLLTQGLKAEDAEDVAQDVFLRIFDHRVLDHVDRSKGRFRNLIIGVTKNVLQAWREHRSAQKRGGGAATLPLNDELVAEDEQFDKLWARHVLALAMTQMEGKFPHYASALNLYLDGHDQKSIAARLGKTPDQINNYIHRAKTVLTSLVKEAIRDYCATPEEFSTEFDHLSEFLK